MKKLLTGFILVLLLLVSACSQSTGGSEGETSNENESSNGKEEKVITLWHIDSGKKEELLKEQVAKFEEANPGVKVDVLRIANDDFKQKLSVAMSGQEPPDVFFNWGGGWLRQFVGQGMVLDLTNKVSTDRFIKDAVSNTTFDDKLYGLPFGMGIDVIFYNKEIFEKYNLEEPKTYEEFVNVVKTLKENDIIPIALANKTKWPGAYYLMNFASRIAGPELFESAFNRTGRGFDDPAYVQAGEYIQELVEMDAFNPGFNGVPYDQGQGRQLMYSGQAAMMDITISFLNNVRSEAPDFEEKLGFFLFPTLEGGKGDQTHIGGAVGPNWSISSTAKEPELAIKLIETLTTKEAAQKYVDETGTLTSIKGVVPKDDFIKELNQVVEQSTHIQMPYDQTLPAELAELHKDTTQAIFGLSMTPEEAAAKMEEKAKELLD